MNKKTIGVFFGSRSPEHDISIITAQLVISGLKGLGYNVVPVYLSKKGEWLFDEKLGDLKTFTNPDFDPSWRTKYRNFVLDLEASVGKLVFKEKRIFGKKIVVDLAFPAFHGSFGEDGTIQGMFEILDVPYVGCDVASSAITMDKILTKQLFHAESIPTTKFVFFDDENWRRDKNEIGAKLKKLHWPLVVKPSRLGSSIGVAKVSCDQELEQAVDVALHFGKRVLAEEAVKNLMDVTCCVLGNEDPIPSLLQESAFGKAELFSYEEKYLKGGGAQFEKAQGGLVIPARLDETTTNEIRDLAVRIYKLFGCSGIARVDFLYDKNIGKIYANEINTLPGTLYHHLWKESGMEFSTLLQKLLNLAVERNEEKKQKSYIFESDILKYANQRKLRAK